MRIKEDSVFLCIWVTSASNQTSLLVKDPNSYEQSLYNFLHSKIWNICNESSLLFNHFYFYTPKIFSFFFWFWVFWFNLFRFIIIIVILALFILDFSSSSFYLFLIFFFYKKDLLHILHLVIFFSNIWEAQQESTKIYISYPSKSIFSPELAVNLRG